MTARDLCTLILVEIGVIDPITAPEDWMLAHVLTVTNRLLDSWNADRRAVYTQQFAAFTLTPNHQPHLIGPGLGAPDFAMTVRPESIEAANIILTNLATPIRQPLRLRDAAWWASNPIQGITTSFPTDLYYEPDWPNGSCFLWPVPTTAWGFEIEARVLLTALADLNATFSLPPGYQEAIARTVEETILPTFGRMTGYDAIHQQAIAARARVFGANTPTIRIRTQDAGMPTAGGNRPAFNFWTGLTT